MPTAPSRWQAILRARCPRCRVGPIFARWRFPGFGALHPMCPECGLLYQREQGYFLGAMYISSLIVTALIFVFHCFGRSPHGVGTRCCLRRSDS